VRTPPQHALLPTIPVPRLPPVLQHVGAGGYLGPLRPLGRGHRPAPSGQSRRTMSRQPPNKPDRQRQCSDDSLPRVTAPRVSHPPCDMNADWAAPQWEGRSLWKERSLLGGRSAPRPAPAPDPDRRRDPNSARPTKSRARSPGEVSSPNAAQRSRSTAAARSTARMWTPAAPQASLRPPRARLIGCGCSPRPRPGASSAPLA